MSGLDWDALGITSVRTAGNAIQAREILEKERIDVLLCDIEMPGEMGFPSADGHEGRGMDFVCIFPYFHADFMYAKEAIKLNCFDYILQPARYEDIQSTVAKAIQRVKKNMRKRTGAIWNACQAAHPRPVPEPVQRLGRRQNTFHFCFTRCAPAVGKGGYPRN